MSLLRLAALIGVVSLLSCELNAAKRPAPPPPGTLGGKVVASESLRTSIAGRDLRAYVSELWNCASPQDVFAKTGAETAPGGTTT